MRFFSFAFASFAVLTLILGISSCRAYGVRIYRRGGATAALTTHNLRTAPDRNAQDNGLPIDGRADLPQLAGSLPYAHAAEIPKLYYA